MKKPMFDMIASAIKINLSLGKLNLFIYSIPKHIK